MKSSPNRKIALVNTTATCEHVSDTEREIRTIKEGARTTVSTLTRVGLRFFPKQMIIHIVYFSVFWTNVPPAENDISSMWSPREIILGRIVDHNLHCREVFRAYDVSMYTDTTTTMSQMTCAHARLRAFSLALREICKKLLKFGI